MIGWKLTAGAAALSLLAGFGSGWQVRDWIAAEAAADQADANTEALADELEKARNAAEEARQRALEAAGRVDSLETENASLRASLSRRATNVEISDPCAQCRLGADAVGLLRDAAAGSAGDPGGEG